MTKHGRDGHVWWFLFGLLACLGCPRSPTHVGFAIETETERRPDTSLEPSPQTQPDSIVETSLETLPPDEVPSASGTSSASKHFHPFAPGSIEYRPPFNGKPLASELRDGGLQVDDFVIGQGESVKEGHYVTFHYTGYLDDGYVFDCTRRRHRPYSFFVGAHQVIEGWDRGLRDMRVGGQRRLVVPATLAFGDRGRPQVLPGSTITFTVELLRVQGPFARPTSSCELRVPGQASPGSDLRVPHEEGSRAAALGDRLFVHYEQRDNEGRVRETTHRFGIPRLVIVERFRWTEGLSGLRVGGIRRVRTNEGTSLVELIGFDESGE